MNKNGFELAISTIILIIIGILVLIGLVIFLKGGFSSFTQSTQPITDATSRVGAQQACRLLCSADDACGYCLHQFTVSGKNTTCPSITESCSIDCRVIRCAEP